MKRNLQGVPLLTQSLRGNTKEFFSLLPVLSSQDKAGKLHESLLTERGKRG